MGKLLYYKESPGVVCGIKDKTMSILLLDSCNADKKCSAGCGCCGEKKGIQRKITVQSGNYGKGAIGDRVTIRYFEINELFGAIIVFGIPLSASLLSLFCWYLFSPATIESLPSIILTGICFAAGFLIVKLIDRYFRTVFPAEIMAKTVVTDTIG